MNILTPWLKQHRLSSCLKLGRLARQSAPGLALGAAACGAALVLGTGVVCLPLSAAEPKAPVEESVEQPPAPLLEWVQQLDAAASRQDLNEVKKYYSSTLVHGDGLSYKAWSDALAAFWAKTSQTTYKTTIDRWQSTAGDRLVFETTTTITGTQMAADRPMKLHSVVRSRQTLAGQKIVAQDILSEKTRLTSGPKPPEVKVLLPETVTVGQSFTFDVIVQDPLGDQLLLGSALEEQITPEAYQKPAQITLEPLTAGGLFKVGQAPKTPTREWISAVLVQEGGMTIISQRLAVVEAKASAEVVP